MENQKEWWKSVGLQGSIVTFLGLVVSLLKLVFGVEIAQSAEITGLVSGLFTLVGIVMTIIGRIRATKKIAFGRIK